MKRVLVVTVLGLSLVFGMPAVKPVLAAEDGMLTLKPVLATKDGMPAVKPVLTAKDGMPTEMTQKEKTHKADAHKKRERHPAIHAALRKLRKVKANLSKAPRDYGGHRVKAIQAIDQAIQELTEALKSDKAAE